MEQLKCTWSIIFYFIPLICLLFKHACHRIFTIDNGYWNYYNSEKINCFHYQPQAINCCHNSCDIWTTNISWYDKIYFNLYFCLSLTLCDTTFERLVHIRLRIRTLNVLIYRNSIPLFYLTSILLVNLMVLWFSSNLKIVTSPHFKRNRNGR